MTLDLPAPLLVATLGLPSSKLSNNAKKGSARKHKAAITSAQKQEAVAEFRKAMQAQARWPLDGATCIPVFYRKRGGLLLRDELNAGPFLKAVFDGAERAGLVVNDSLIRCLPAELRVDKANPRLEIWVYSGRLEYTGEGAP